MWWHLNTFPSDCDPRRNFYQLMRLAGTCYQLMRPVGTFFFKMRPALRFEFETPGVNDLVKTPLQNKRKDGFNFLFDWRHFRMALAPIFPIRCLSTNLIFVSHFEGGYSSANPRPDVVPGSVEDDGDYSDQLQQGGASKGSSASSKPKHKQHQHVKKMSTSETRR